MAEVVAPALARGETVVSDRFTASTTAYQGYGRGLDRHELVRMMAFAPHDLEPDLTVLLDVDLAVARARLGDEIDRIEGGPGWGHAGHADGRDDDVRLHAVGSSQLLLEDIFARFSRNQSGDGGDAPGDHQHELLVRVDGGGAPVVSAPVAGVQERAADRRRCIDAVVAQRAHTLAAGPFVPAGEPPGIFRRNGGQQVGAEAEARSATTAPPPAGDA